ncbi:MAG: IS1380 family transposase [Marinilabilia sp.]
MRIESVAHSNKATVGHAGLSLISEMARICGLDDTTRGITPMKQPQISDPDILRSLCGLIAQGKTDFDHIREFAKDSFFQESLGINRIPSAEILRQRFENMSCSKFENRIVDCCMQLARKTEVKPEYTTIGDGQWVRLDTDITVFDNADTKKEGAGFTYDGRYGFSPIFAHLGGGWMVNAELRPGSTHSFGPGTLDFVSQSLDNARQLVDDRLLFVADGGFDSKDLLDLLAREDTDFIIKHNLRNESKIQWLQGAKAHGREVKSTPDKKVYQGSLFREVEGFDRPVRMVFEVTEIKSRKGQLLLSPEVIVFSAWTSLDAPVEEVLQAYRDRGTSEQYHAEFKSELDMERLPSGKFAVNSAFLKMGMLVYNMFKVVGQDMVFAKALGLKKATRRRMKTVMRSVMYMCGRITRHARKLVLHLACPKPWYDFFSSLLMRLQAV